MTTMPGTFSSQVILVAGGTGGLGRAVSLAFLQAGATVLATYRSAPELQALQLSAGEHVARLEGHAIDVLDEASLGRFMADVLARHGRLDGLVNAVGGYAAGAPLWEMDATALDKMLAVNLRSGYCLARAVLPAMLAQRRGAIVNVAAMAAVNHLGAAAAYVASKAAAVALIDSLAVDLKGTGVRANSILPSVIDTEANRKAMPGAAYASWPKPEEIAEVILFLCSDAARLINGASIPV